MRRCFLAASLLLLAACSGDDKNRPVAVGPETGAGDQKSQLVRAAPQKSDGRAVLVQTVTFGAGKGYVAIHEDGNGAPGQVSSGCRPSSPRAITRRCWCQWTRP